MKKENIFISRRTFTKLSAAALGSIPLLGFQNSLRPNPYQSKDTLKVNIFSKHLQFLDYNDMSAAVAEMGFDGLDLTVRPKGHVLPEKAEEDLPKAVNAMKKYGLKPSLLTTNIWDLSDPTEKVILATASTLNFTHYRTGWLRYPADKTKDESQEIYAQQAKKLEILNKELQLIGCYQNHAGNYVGASIWDIPAILSETKNKNMGCQYDIRHAVVEGGTSWELGLRKILPYIKSLVIKDFKWNQEDGKWTIINTPLGEGMVNFSHYFSLLKKYQIEVPVSLHLEYDLGGAEKGNTQLTIDKKEVFRRIKKDLTFLRETYTKA